VRAHVADGDGLARGSCSGRGSGSLCLSGTDPADEPTTYPLGSADLTAREGTGPRNKSSRPVIIGSLSEEHA